MTFEELAAKAHNEGRDVIVGFTRSGDLALIVAPSLREKLVKIGMHDGFLYEGVIRRRYLMDILDGEASWDKDLCYVSQGCEHRYDIVG